MRFQSHVENKHAGIVGSDKPDSVLGVAIVTSRVQVSQHISSSFFPGNPPNHLLSAFLLLFSKNCTAIRPRTPPLGELGDDDRCCRTRALTRESMRVSSSTSSIAGKVKSRTSSAVGRTQGKNRWKKMVCKMPGTVSLLVQNEKKEKQNEATLGRAVVSHFKHDGDIFVLHRCLRVTAHL